MPAKSRKRFFLISTWLSFLNLIFPSLCKLCRKRLNSDELLLCNDCLQVLYKFRLYKSKIELDDKSKLFSYFKFENNIKDLIYLFKYNSYIPIGKDLAFELLNAIDDKHLINYDFIQAVPLTKKKLRKRGFNQAELIAKKLSRKKKIKKISILKKEKETLSQAYLSLEERKFNLKDCFVIKKIRKQEKYKNKSLLIVDDILTTGSTFFEIRKVLKPLEFKNIDILTLATPKNI